MGLLFSFFSIGHSLNGLWDPIATGRLSLSRPFRPTSKGHGERHGFHEMSLLPGRLHWEGVLKSTDERLQGRAQIEKPSHSIHCLFRHDLLVMLVTPQSPSPPDSLRLQQCHRCTKDLPRGAPRTWAWQVKAGTSLFRDSPVLSK